MALQMKSTIMIDVIATSCDASQYTVGAFGPRASAAADDAADGGCRRSAPAPSMGEVSHRQWLSAGGNRCSRRANWQTVHELVRGFKGIYTAVYACEREGAAGVGGGMATRIAYAVLLLGALLSTSGSNAVGVPSERHAAPSPPLRQPPRGVLLALRGGGGPALDLSFSVVCDSTFLGENIGVVGECEELGQWKNVQRMTALEVACPRERERESLY